jgi:hypothetical protein
MKSTPLLIPRPVDILNTPIGVKVPIILGHPRVPYEKVQRLRSISRMAPENASEAVNGLGSFAPVHRNAFLWGKKSHFTSAVRRKKIHFPTVPQPYRPTITRARQPFHGQRYGYNTRGWMAFNGLGDDLPAAQPNIWSTINTSINQPAVTGLISTGTNFYVQQQTNKQQQSLLSTQAQTAALQAQLARQQAAAAAANAPKSGMPGWVIPAAAVGGVALVAFLFLRK